MLEKMWYDGEGEQKPSLRPFLILAQTVTCRARAGLISLLKAMKRTSEPDSSPEAKRTRIESEGQTTVASSTSSSAAPAGPKHSIKSDSAAPTKRARLKSGDSDGVKTG